MNLTDALNIQTHRRPRRRVGRGRASGHGKTSGRGSNGQRSRSGGGVRIQFEGGQTPLFRRLPKRGFTNIFKKEYVLVNLSDLERLPVEKTTVDIELLRSVGLVRRMKNSLKVLGEGQLTRPLTVRAHKFSARARQKIIEAGGRVEEVS